MKTTYGTRASICAHFNWTLDYLENGISWAKVIRMMSDLPQYDSETETTKPATKITEQNADELLKMFNS